MLAVFVALGAPAQAAQVINQITGNLSSSENGCNRLILIFTGRDCSYGNDLPQPGGWIGPAFTGAYYAPGTAGDSVNYVPTAGDGRISPVLSGTLTIDDSGTAGVADDVLSGTLTIGPMARNVWTGNGDRAVERWDSMTHVLAPTAVSSATANGQGGWDYIIGAQGFPSLICSLAGAPDCFASGNAPPMVPSGNFWAGPAAIGIERSPLLGGNAGTQTTAVFANYSCSDTLGDNDCTASDLMWQAGEDPGFDNLLLRIATDGAGNIVSGSAFWTQEFRIAAFGETSPENNSWEGGTMTFAGSAVVPIPAAIWLFSSGLGVMGWLRREVSSGRKRSLPG